MELAHSMDAQARMIGTLDAKTPLMANPHEINFQDALSNVILEAVEAFEENAGDEVIGQIKDVVTYQDAGLLTSNAGLVIRLMDGSEFQVQIIKSK